VKYKLTAVWLTARSLLTVSPVVGYGAAACTLLKMLANSAVGVGALQREDEADERMDL